MSKDQEEKQEPSLEQIPSKTNSAAQTAPIERNATGNVDAPEVEQEFSKVATNPKQSIMILVGIGAVFLYLFFNLFFAHNNTEPKKEPTPVPDEVAKPIPVGSDTDIPSIPTLPSPPKLEDPTPPPPPPTDETLSSPDQAAPVNDKNTPLELPANVDAPFANNTNNTDNVAPPFYNNPQTDDSQKKLEDKRKSAIVLVSSEAPAKTASEIQQETDFTYRGDSTLLLGRGKMLDAIIETAINTDFGGEIRAVITRDVYSEQGKNILIPKGSRVFGNYAVGTDGVYGRIAITWTRVDLANGYVLNLSGTGMDSLGRSGAQGRIDNKFKERFTNTVLRSAFNITLARALDSLVAPVSSTAAVSATTQAATNVKNITTAILLDTTTYPSDTTKVTAICAQTLAAITDQTSSLYTTINTACNTTYADDTAKLAAVTAAVNSASDTAVQTATASTQETKAQAATTQAYSDISDTVKTLIEEQEFTPTITIDQGTPIKIYVNKDYVFPKEALRTTKIMK
jgi:type IV secretion system protein VirB10